MSTKNGKAHEPDWDDVRVFLEVARSGSATEAAGRLGINYTTVSRRISALENCLGKQLFKRSNGAWVITPVGERLLPHAQAMAEHASGITWVVTEELTEVKGPLRVTAEYCADRVLLPTARLFAQRYPEVDLQIIASATLLDVEAGEVDIALHMTDEPPANLVGKRVARVGFAVYASPGLCEKVIADPGAADIPCLAWVRDESPRLAWIDSIFPNTTRVYRTTSLPVMLAMAREGIGVARLPCVLGDPDPLLVRLPPYAAEPGPDLWVLSNVDVRTTARVRIFRDFLVEELEKQKDLIEGNCDKRAPTQVPN